VIKGAIYVIPCLIFLLRVRCASVRRSFSIEFERILCHASTENEAKSMQYCNTCDNTEINGRL
jgi:hypothetical protein